MYVCVYALQQDRDFSRDVSSINMLRILPRFVARCMYVCMHEYILATRSVQQCNGATVTCPLSVCNSVTVQQ